MTNSKPLSLADLVSLRFERMRKSLGLSQEAVAEGSLMSRSNYVNKTTRAAGVQPFTLEQVEAVANYFRRVTGRKLTGWPFVEEDVSSDFDKIVDIIDSRRR